MRCSHPPMRCELTANRRTRKHEVAKSPREPRLPPALVVACCVYFCDAVTPLCAVGCLGGTQVGPVRRVIMGLDRVKKSPCGFCFVE